MKDYCFVVMTNPAPGRDAEYNDWYTNQHLRDVVAVEGFVSARRFKLAAPDAEGAPRHSYLALYTMRTDDPQTVLASLTKLAGTEKMQISPALDPDTVTILYEAISGEVRA